MEKEKLILTDIDGVWLRWDEGFMKYAIDNGLTYIPGTDQYYNLAKRFEEDWDTVVDLVNRFNHSDHMGDLQPLPGAAEYAKKLVAEGFKFIAITSLSDRPSAKEQRVKNLQKLFGDIFEEVICLETGSAKGHVLERWADSGLPWIEDHFMNAEAGYEVGLNPILVHSPTNEKYSTELFPRTCKENQWSDIYKHIHQMYT